MTPYNYGKWTITPDQKIPGHVKPQRPFHWILHGKWALNPEDLYTPEQISYQYRK